MIGEITKRMGTPLRPKEWCKLKSNGRKEEKKQGQQGAQNGGIYQQTTRMQKVVFRESARGTIPRQGNVEKRTPYKKRKSHFADAVENFPTDIRGGSKIVSDGKEHGGV